MKTFKKIAAVVGILFGLLIIWGLIEPYIINVEEEEASISNLPESWEGKEIAVIGDFQVGMWGDNTNTIKRMVDRLIERDPAAVLLLGDYIYHSVDDPTAERKKVAELLRPLTESGIPVIGVLGNHDYAMAQKKQKPNQEAAQQITAKLEEIGVQIVANKSIPLTITETGVQTGTASDEALYVTGLGASWPNNVVVSAALENVPESAPRVVMMHNPEAFDKLGTSTAPAAVAGHTHGGQLRIPFMPEWSYTELMAKDEMHTYGWIEDYGAEGNRLYVNPGVGFSDLPIRINCPPELTILNLQSA